MSRKTEKRREGKRDGDETRTRGKRGRRKTN